MKKLRMWGILVLSGIILSGCGKCEHEYDKGEVSKKPTCAEEGEKTLTCTLCGETKTEPVKMKAHAYQQEISKEPTFDEEGEEIFTCEACGDSYTKSIPVRDDEIVVTVTNKTNIPKDIHQGLYSDQVIFTFDVLNRTDQAVKGVQGVLKTFDLFDKEIVNINCDFTGTLIPAGESVTVGDLGIDVNEFMDEDVKLYNTDFSDLKFE